MNRLLQAYFIPTITALGVFLGLLVAIRPTRPSIPIAPGFAKPYITYWGPSAHGTALCVEEQASLFDTQVLFLPHAACVALPPTPSPLSILQPPCIDFGKALTFTQDSSDVSYGWPRADERPLLALLDSFGEIAHPPLPTPSSQPQVWVYGAPPSSLSTETPQPLLTPAPLTGTLWQPVSYLVHLENGLLIGPALRESSTTSTETDATLQALTPRASRLESMGYYRLTFAP